MPIIGFSRCYKNEIFHLYLQFFNRFILQMHIIAQAYLRCCGVAKKERKPYRYWNTTRGFNLVIVVINTPFSHAKVTTFGYLSHATGKLHQNLPERLWSKFSMYNILHSHTA